MENQNKTPEQNVNKSGKMIWGFLGIIVLAALLYLFSDNSNLLRTQLNSDDVATSSGAILITSHKDGATVKTSSVTLEGQVIQDSDTLQRGDVAAPSDMQVEVLINDGTWQVAQGFEKWSLKIALEEGENTISARVVYNTPSRPQPLETSLTLNYSPEDPIVPPPVMVNETLCGTANGQFYSSEQTSFGSDTFCIDGVNSDPKEPPFPTPENPVTQWVCYAGGEGVNNTPNASVWSPRFAVYNDLLYNTYRDDGKTRAEVLNGFWQPIDGGNLNNRNDTRSSTPQDFIEYQGNLYGAWVETLTSASPVTHKVWLKYYDGSTWTRLNTTALNAPLTQRVSNIDLEVHNDQLYIAWNQYRDGTPGDTFVQRYNGTTWEQVGEALDFNINEHTWSPKLVVFDNELYAFWYEGTEEQWLGSVKVKKLKGDTWVSLERATTIGNNNQLAKYSTLDAIVYDNQLYVVWSEDDASGTGKLYLRRYNGTTWEQVGESFLNYDQSQFAIFPSLAVHDGDLYISWNESPSQNQPGTIRVKKYNSGTNQWGTFPILNFDPQRGAGESDLMANGNLYATWWEETANGNRLVRVKMLNGNEWVPGERFTSDCSASKDFGGTGQQYTVTAQVQGDGGTVDPTSQTVDAGATARITITPDEGYALTSLTDNDDTVDMSLFDDQLEKNQRDDSNSIVYEIRNVQENHTVLATFAEEGTSSVIIVSLTPDEGPAETNVTVKGEGFSPNDNTVLLLATATKATTEIPGVPSEDGVTLTFSVPESSNPGGYLVSVQNDAGTVSNALSFTVTGDSQIQIELDLLDPPSGEIETRVVARGEGFSAKDNTALFRNPETGFGIKFTGLAAEDNGTYIAFTVPELLEHPDCLTTVNCPEVAEQVQPGEYEVSVTNVDGQTSNTLTFTVTGDGNTGGGGEVCTLRGDMNCDEKVNDTDLAIVRAFIVGDNLPDQFNLDNGDVASCTDRNSDGINSTSVALYRDYIVDTNIPKQWAISCPNS